MHLRRVAIRSHRASTISASEFSGDTMPMDSSGLYKSMHFSDPESHKSIGSDPSGVFARSFQARGRYFRAESGQVRLPSLNVLSPY